MNGPPEEQLDSTDIDACRKKGLPTTLSNDLETEQSSKRISMFKDAGIIRNDW
jgi:hypothetical protein